MKITSFAKTISFVLNPMVIFVFLPFFLVYKSIHDLTSAFHWSLYTLLFLIVQSLFVFIAVKKRIFTDLDVSKREQRPLLFLMLVITGIFYLTSLFLFNAPTILIVATLGIIFGVVVASIINKRIKASMHVATLTALTLIIAVGYGGYFFLLLLLIPLVAWSRIKIKRHTLKETITGGIVGSLLSLIVYSAYVAVKAYLYK